MPSQREPASPASEQPERAGRNGIQSGRAAPPRRARLLRPPVPWKQFLSDLWRETQDDNISVGAAALAYFLMLSIFPAAIFLLSLLPYLPIPRLDQAIMDVLRQAMPAQAAELFTTNVQRLASERRGGLLSLGALVTLWTASSGLYAVMQQLNITYDVKEARPFWKARATALLLVVLFGVLIIGAFGLIVFGGVLQEIVAEHLGWSTALLAFFAAFRWAVIFGLILLGFAVTYYFGPDVEQTFRFISPGSIFGGAVLVLAGIVFRLYVESFGSYEATYGSLGAAIILLLWLYVAGLVILLGSEINALWEHYAREGKKKGEKQLR